MKRWITPLPAYQALALGLLVLGLAFLAGSVGGFAREKTEGAAEPPKSEPAALGVEREALSYGGKNFYQWRTQLQTELKPELRIEGVKALTAFGVNGYGKEAALAIFTVMKKVDLLDPDQGKLWEVGTQILRVGPPGVGVVSEALAARDRQSRRYAADVLRGINPWAFPEDTLEALRKATPAWIRTARTGDDDVVGAVLQAVGNLDPKNPEFLALILESLRSENASIVLLAVNTLKAAKPRREVRKVVALLTPLLTKRFEDDGGASEVIRREVVGILGGYGADAREAVPGLLELWKSHLNKGGELRRLCVITLGQIGPEAQQAAPLLRQDLRRRPLEPDEQREITRALELIEGK
jgi:hypothetical protein